MEKKQLKDRFNRVHDYIRISVTDKCNLRCVYCMPEEGLTFFPDDRVLSHDEIVQLVQNFADLGVTKVRLTGGEPLLRSDIVEIVRDINAIPEITDISVTTNGLALPRLAQDLKNSGLKRLNVSLDTFIPERYREITRGGNLKRVLKGIEVASEVGFEQIKINTVIIKGENENEIADFLRYTMEKPVNVRFIEFMPIGEENKSKWEKDYFSLDHVFEICNQNRWQYTPVDQIFGNGPADNYQIEGAKGTFGLIHPVSCRFCEGCNRLRITADGYLKSCLYWDDEVNIRETIFQPDLFEQQVRRALENKPENHEMALKNQAEVLNNKPTWRHMSQIGG